MKEGNKKFIPHRCIGSIDIAKDFRIVRCIQKIHHAFVDDSFFSVDMSVEVK